MFNCIRNCLTVAQGGSTFPVSTSFFSERSSFSTCLLAVHVVTVFVSHSHRCAVISRWGVSCLPLLTDDVERVVICLFAMCMLLRWKVCHFMYSTHFLIGLFLLLLSFQISLDIIDTNPLSEIYVCKCSLPVYSLTFQALNRASHRGKILNFYQPRLLWNHF